MTKPFRPSNGTDGMIFMAKFCDQCVHMREDGREPCAILGATLAFDIKDPEYPKEWVQEDYGDDPRCTAFVLDKGDKEPEATRCPKTMDMFNEK